MSGPYLKAISAALDRGREGIIYLLDAGVNSDFFPENSDGRKVYDFVRQYIGKHTGHPDPDTIHGMIGIKLPDVPPEALDFWAETLHELYLRSRVADVLGASSSEWRSGNTVASYKQLQAGARDLRNLTSSRDGGVIEIHNFRGQLESDYLEMKRGAMGAPVPWPTYNGKMRGLWPEEMVFLAGRTAMGKTWILNYWMEHCRSLGERVLLVTTEMSRQAMARRMSAIRYHLDYDLLRQGQLPKLQEDRYLSILRGEHVEGYDEDPEIAGEMFITGGDFTSNLEAVEAACEQVEPTILAIDGLYLFEAPGSKEHERMGYLAHQTKMLLKRLKIPGVCTHQLNRDGARPSARGGGARLENLASSDKVAWDSDYVFIIERNDDTPAGQTTIIPAKHREAQLSKLSLHWQFTPYITFHEVGMPSPVKASGNPFGPPPSSSNAFSSFGTGGSSPDDADGLSTAPDDGGDRVPF